MGHILDSIAPILGGIVGNLVLPGVGAPIGAALTSGGVNYSQTHNLGSAAKAGALSGAGSFVGGNIGNALIPGAGNVADALESGLGPDLGSTVGQALGGSAMNASLGGIAGSALGSNIAGSFAPQGPGKRAGTYPYVPGQVSPGNGLPSGTLSPTGGLPNGALPPSISAMSTLTPNQQTSSLATQGAYGGGLGPQEQQYFLNQVNNQLAPGGSGQALNPVENTYLSKLGLGGYGDSTSLLKAISQWSPQT